MSYLGDLGTFLKGEREGVTLELDNKLNAIAPYSGYLAVSKKLDNFYFQTSSSFIASLADKNRYVKFLDKVVDTWSAVIQTTSTQAANATATTLTMSNTTGLTVGKVIAILKGDLLVHTSVITAVSTNVSITVLNSFNREATAYKIKIIQSINLNDYIPDVLVQDEATNGLTIQTSVNAGDYVVVDRKELITNGTFDTDTSGWTAINGTLSINGSNQLVITATNTATNAIASQIISTVIGKKYIVELYLAKGTANADILVGTGQGAADLYNATDVSNTTMSKLSFNFTATTTTTYIGLKVATVSIGNTALFDNISVKQVDETYRAKIDAPIGTSLTNITYFEVRDNIGVTNQIGVFHKYNILTSSYEGLSAEILFSDASKEDLLDNPTWLSRNGFSKAGEYCYSKGTYLYLPVSIWQSLNKGAYHEFINKFGTKATWSTTASDAKRPWFGATAKQLLSVADSFLYSAQAPDGGTGSITTSGTTSIGGVSYNNGAVSYDSVFYLTRPDSKFYDIVYPDQVIGIREYAKVLNKWEVDIIWRDKEENGVEEVVFTEQVTQTTTGTVATLEVSNGANYKVGSVLQIWNGTTPYRRYVVSVIGNTVTLDSAIVKTAVSFIISGGKIPALGSDKSSKSRLLGIPTNFPTIMTNRLAESKYIIGLDLQMVDDLGNNQLFDGVKDSFKLGDKFTNILQSLRSTNSGSTYTAFTATNSIISNALTLTDEPTANIVLVNMTAKNNPYAQTTPKSVIEVLPKVKASNSHSIYKGALVGNQVSDKIQVGNGTNGYESKVLENVNFVNSLHGTDNNKVFGVTTYFDAGETLLSDKYDIGDTTYTGAFATIRLTDGTVYDVSRIRYVDATRTIIYLKSSYGNVSSKIFAGSVVTINTTIPITTPTHSQIVLDNTNSPASKWFEILEEGNNGILAGVYGKGLAYNVGTTSYDGDNELFDQLYNGSKTDLNGQTIRTFHGSIAINGRIK